MIRLRFVDRDQVRDALPVAAEVVAQSGVVLFPTESFYGLGGDPSNRRAVEKIHSMKNRPTGLGLPVLCADWEQLEKLVVVPERFRLELARRWPAALTVVLGRRTELPAARGRTLAVRIPGHGALRALLYRSGPLTGTSANLHDAPPFVEADEALDSLVGRPDLVLDGGPTAGGDASTLVDLTGDSPRVLRPGRCPWVES
ncbi:MAG: L-threonylcarbamoyladenylate synthase [Thermoanaerobaculales bacterium]